MTKFPKKELLLLFFTVILTLSIGEIILRISYPLYSNYHTEMWRYSKELKSVNNEKECHRHLANRNMVLYGVNVSTNSLGLRDKREFKIPKPENITRILVIGDSVTFGWGVYQNETYSKHLERLLNSESKNSFQVINAGVGNYNTQCELELLKDLLILEPDVVVWGFFINDIEEIYYPNSYENFFKNTYLYAFLFDKYVHLKYKYGSEDFESYYTKLYEKDRLKENLMASFSSVINLTEKAHTNLVFVNIPFFYRFEQYPFNEVNNMIEKEFSNQRILYLDVLSIFNESNNQEKIYWVSEEDPHPNSQVHKQMGEFIYRELIKSKYINITSS